MKSDALLTEALHIDLLPLEIYDAQGLLNCMGLRAVWPGG